MAATWELLQSPQVTEDQLAAVQRGWAAMRLIESAQNALLMERAQNERLLDQMRSSGKRFRQVLGLAGGGSGNPSLAFGASVESFLEQLAAGARGTHWSWCLSYPDQLRALKGSQVLLESMRSVQSGQPFLAAVARQQAQLHGLGIHSKGEDFGPLFGAPGNGLRSLFSDCVDSLSRVLPRVFVAEASRELALTALALKRYQLRHGQFPADLSALVPGFLPSLPRDPADGQALRYRPKPDGTFLLYSIGEDGVDNGGDGSSATKTSSYGWQRGRDLVWPMPATPAQVSAYQAKQATKP
jgi:hypothetical protein